jgi:hypothetical protein
MNRMRVALFHKIVPVSFVAVLLLCAPLQLTAQDREPRAAAQSSVIEWVSSLWNDLTSWLAGGVPSTPPGPDRPTENQDGAGCIDPWGGGCGS